MSVFPIKRTGVSVDDQVDACLKYKRRTVWIHLIAEDAWMLIKFLFSLIGATVSVLVIMIIIGYCMQSLTSIYNVYKDIINGLSIILCIVIIVIFSLMIISDYYTALKRRVDEYDRK